MTAAQQAMRAYVAAHWSTHTSGEIGRALGVSSERVRVIVQRLKLEKKRQNWQPPADRPELPPYQGPVVEVARPSRDVQRAERRATAQWLDPDKLFDSPTAGAPRRSPRRAKPEPVLTVEERRAALVARWACEAVQEERERSRSAGRCLCGAPGEPVWCAAHKRQLVEEGVA